MDKYIKITRHPYEEPHHINLVIEAFNGKTRGELEYYENARCLQEVADALKAFPRHNKDYFLWELGSERAEDNFGFYFRFRVFTTNLKGDCAIQLRFNNNEKLPDSEISEFCIKAEPTGINQLGQLFEDFSKLQHTVLEWDGHSGSVY